MKEQMSPSPAETDNTPSEQMKVRITGLPEGAQEFYVPAIATKSDIAGDRATMIGGEPVESGTEFPGVQDKVEAEALLSSRAEARELDYDSKHAAKPGRHRAGKHRTERTLFSGEQLDAARTRVARVLGTAAVVKDELLDVRELDEGDNGDDELYVGRRRAKGDSRSDRKPEQTSRVKRAADRLAAKLDRELHSRREDDVLEDAAPEAAPISDIEPTVADTESVAPETAEVADGPQAGDTVELDGVTWTIELIDDEGVVLQRENEDGEVEVENKPADFLDQLAPDDLENKYTPEEIGEMLGNIRSKFAGFASERTKRAFESKKKTGQMDNAREELSDMIGAVATEMMDELEAAGISGDAMAEEIDRFVDEQMDSLVCEIEAERAADFDKRRPITQTFLKKWAKWSEPKGGLLSKDRFKSSMKKSAFFLAPGAALGVVAAPLVAGAAAGTLAVLAGRSVGRHLIGARLTNAANAPQIARDQASELRGYLNESTEASHVELLAVFDAQTEKYRKKNRNRLIGGTAVAMTAGLLSKEVAEYINESGVVDKVGDWLSDRYEAGLPVREVETQAPAIVEPAEKITSAEMFDGTKSSTEFTKDGLKDFNSWVSKDGGYEVKSGDTVWDISEKYLESQGVKNPNKYQIDAVKDDVLKELKAKGFVNRKGWLNSGDIIKLK